MATTQASWNGSASTIPTFINTLFSANVRNATVVQQAIGNGQFTFSFADATSCGLILNAWLAAWQNANGDPCNQSALAMCPATDQTLIGFLSGFIKSGNLSMSVPQLHYSSLAPPNSKKQQYAIYQNKGYETQPFLTNGAWNYGTVNSSGQVPGAGSSATTVASFLSALYYGAHMVVVSNAQDLQVQTGPAQLWQTFVTSQLDISGDKLNSHYGPANLTGFYYLDVPWFKVNPYLLQAVLVALTDPAELETATGTVMPQGLLVPAPIFEGGDLTGPVPFDQALLLHAQGRRGASNSFIQLEGWQNHIPWFGGWHTADYDAHTATLWNFSTFGACAYSEKRSAPIFLAGSGFSTALNAQTHMPLYTGASALEDWMNPNLLQLPSS